MRVRRRGMFRAGLRRYCIRVRSLRGYGCAIAFLYYDVGWHVQYDKYGFRAIGLCSRQVHIKFSTSYHCHEVVISGPRVE